MDNGVLIPKMEDSKESSGSVRKSCILSKIPKAKVSMSPFSTEKSVNITSRLRSGRMEVCSPASKEQRKSSSINQLPAVAKIKMFSDLSSQARPNSPATSFERFFVFHQEIEQAVTDMEKIQAATTSSDSVAKEDSSSILQEIVHNSPKPSNGKQLRSHGSKKASSNAREVQESSSTSLGSSIKLVREVQTEAASWFMGFLEAALEGGMKKTKGGDGQRSPASCPQSLILKVINWVEVEQSDSSKRPVHPRAAQIQRKLRIKAKNP